MSADFGVLLQEGEEIVSCTEGTFLTCLGCYFRVCACLWVSLAAKMLIQGRFVEMPTKAIVSVSNAVPIVEGIYVIDYA